MEKKETKYHVISLTVLLLINRMRNNDNKSQVVELSTRGSDLFS